MPDDANAPEQPWTIGRLLAWTTDYLAAKKSESPRLDAEVLLADVLKYERVQLYTSYAMIVSDAARGAFRELVKRRAAGEPVAYLVGRKEFYSLPLAVSPAVLIPRPDTETLVAEFLTRFKDRATPRVLELGTGSGAIALAIAKQHESSHIVATDLSTEALGVARSNAKRHGLTARIDFRAGDLFEPIPTGEVFDAVLCNPPYIPTNVIPTLEPGVRDFEPHIALDGGPDGLDVVRRIVADAVEHLVPGGCLLLEIGTEQEAPVRALIEATGQYELAPTVRDAANHPRVVRATRRP
jgi:release factor glutamine methyltransferase